MRKPHFKFEPSQSHTFNSQVLFNSVIMQKTRLGFTLKQFSFSTKHGTVGYSENDCAPFNRKKPLTDRSSEKVSFCLILLGVERTASREENTDAVTYKFLLEKR